MKDRFESGYMAEPNTGCWLWPHLATRGGYGRIFSHADDTGRKRYQFAHRYSWIIHNGEIPKGLMVCHRCDVPCCVNPKHLFLGTAKDNMRDARQKGRMVRCGRKLGKRRDNPGHCWLGHFKAGVRKSGYTYCKECDRMQRLNRKEKVS